MPTSPLRILASTALLARTASPTLAQDMRAVYQRAEQFLPAQAAKLVLNVTVGRGGRGGGVR